MPARVSSQQPAANPQQGRRGFRSLRACSQLFVYILNETASEEFAFLHAVPCCAPLSALTACASEGNAHPRLGRARVTLRCTGSAFGKGGGGCLQREEVSQAVVDEGESKAGEQFSAPESFIIELLLHQPT